jgi:uncharacterized protein (DUF1800 family)
MSVRSAIAVNRFGLGAAPGELSAASSDPRGWLDRQIAAPAPAAEAFSGLAATSDALREYPRWIASLGRARADMRSGMSDSSPATVEGTFREHFTPIMRAEIGARLAAGAATATPFQERLALFWANHFTVSAEKALIFALVGPYEREAIRPHVTGRFGDMLLAVARHPAMLMYLDNHLSVRQGWQPRQVARSAAFPPPSGLNENLAREILELHTLGVNGGYTQADVTEFARVLTGWTARPIMNVPEGGASGFVFAAARHEPGPRTLLGKTYAEDGAAQGEAVLRDLAVHPATAKHIATKLVRHFIADEPPPAAVARVERAFLESGGELQRVYAALLDSPEAWQPSLVKLKTPIEYVVSCMRALPEARAAKPEALFFTLRGMGQRPFFAPSPQGWPDTAAAWGGADALWKRIEWAGILASRTGSGVDPMQLARDGYGEALGAGTRRAIERAESRQQGLALWLASPEFQRR